MHGGWYIPLLDIHIVFNLLLPQEQLLLLDLLQGVRRARLEGQCRLDHVEVGKAGGSLEQLSVGRHLGLAHLGRKVQPPGELGVGCD